jgi:hypothetical protein
MTEPTKGWQVAFSASEHLYDKDLRFINNIKSGDPAPQATLLSDMLNLLVLEIIDNFFVKPTDIVKLGSMGQKIVDGSV